MKRIVHVKNAAIIIYKAILAEKRQAYQNLK